MSAPTVDEMIARRNVLQIQADVLGGTNGDPATARLGGRALAQHTQRMDRDLRRYSQLSSQIRNLDHKITLAQARAAEAARVRLTFEEVQGSRFVRDAIGWHKVVRVSSKSVTVETPYSWTDRIALAKVLEVRR